MEATKVDPRRIDTDRPGRGFEIRASLADVGLEVGALGPLVPCVDEDELVALRAGPGDGIGQPRLVPFGRRAEEQVGVSMRFARRVVPVGQDTLVARPLRKLEGELTLCEILVEEDEVVSQGRIVQGSPALGQEVVVDVVGQELGCCVEPGERRRRAVPERLELHEEGIADPSAGALHTPYLCRLRWVGEGAHVVDEEDGSVTDADVTFVGEGLRQPANVLAVIFRRVALGDQHLACASIPVAGPRFVRPTKAERKVGRTRVQHLVEGHLEDASSAEPVVVVAEAGDSVRSGECRLRLTHLGDAQVVEAELAGNVRLMVARVQAGAADNVSPLGEARTPPLVVLWGRMELRQIEGEK